MLFHVRMTVNIPRDLPTEVADQLKATEKARAQELQKLGKWRHLWRIAGQYANYSVFDVDSVDELHHLISTLPLFPFMSIEVEPILRHPSSVWQDDR